MFARRNGADPKYRDPAYLKWRASLVAAFQPGQPCTLCGHPLLTVRYAEADHTSRGLTHGTRNRCSTCGKRCNQVDGAKRGRARQDERVTRLRW